MSTSCDAAGGCCSGLRTVLLSGMLLIAMSLSAARAQENWPSYRGPTDQGEAGTAKLPSRWSEQENVVWKTPLAGKAWSSPVIWGNRIWLTSATEDGTQLSVICVDKNSGAVQHNTQVRVVAAPQYCHPFNSYASPSPAVEEGRVYVSFGSPFVGCLDADSGKVVWQRTDFVCNHFRGPGSSPFIYRNLLILHFDGSDRQYVVAVDKGSGKTVWQTNRSVDYRDLGPDGLPDREGDWRKGYSTPVVMEVNGKPLLVSLGSMALYAYEPETGKEVWRTELPGSHSGSSRPVLGHGLVFVPMGMDRELWAVRPDGQGVVTETHVVWKYSRAVPSRSSIILVGDLLFMVDDLGVAACVDAKTGAERWRERIGGDYSSSPIHANGRIYFCNQEGKTTIIEAADKYRQVAVNELADGFMASPAVSGNALFLRTKSNLYRIEER